MGVKVSVIVPIYNVERFIEKCATTLLEQTLEEVEFIFVDDASPDNSVDILKECIEKYPHRKKQIKLISHEINKGLPSARNSGLSVAMGEYIFHCDGDDYVDERMLEVLYEEGDKNNADIVWCDWFLSFRKKERYMHQCGYDTVQGFLRGMLSGKNKYNVWNKLVKKELYDENHICFPDGHPMGEDMTMIRLAACAQRVHYVPQGFYHYVKLNNNSYTYNLTDKRLSDIKYNVNETIDFLISRVDNLDNEINYFKLDIKFPFLISDNEVYYSLWKEWYSESNEYILKNKEVALRRRVLQYMAWKNQFWFVRLYYNLFIKVIYGCIYK